ncbi:YIEGIA family protein [Thermoflavimicrobium daqui]|uniref:YIEGIA protein n=1 Tax=Thermoflavimicrobium daqui TaxID=2137476 RepID=A0A364K0M2_9BACL|nr:YIEGIA family protein [Thermoflavimicrobium daqui]RAL21052.1 hypothetical protein DL897_17345 [Thermoflavimicrobium daqui]
MSQLGHYTEAIIIGILFGLIARIWMLRTDYRQYPTYPHGYIIHLSLGLIAAALGAVAVPALLEKDFTAVTFLTVAAQQFRDVRNMEREMLLNLDEMELVPRGKSYIEGIAMVFEGRNYLTIFTSLLTSLAAVLFKSWWSGSIVGIIVLLLIRFIKSGQVIREIADVSEGEIRIEGPNLYVDDIYIMNIGLDDNKKHILENALGVVLKPKNASGRVTLGNMGQRQAIIHNVSTILGVYRDTGEPALLPLAKRDLKDGRLGIFLLPQDRNIKEVFEVINLTPVLEGAVRQPTQAQN